MIPAKRREALTHFSTPTHLEHTNAPSAHRRHDGKTRRAHVCIMCRRSVSRGRIRLQMQTWRISGHTRVPDNCSRFRGWGSGKRHLRLRRLCLLTIQQNAHSCPVSQSARPILRPAASHHDTEYTCSLSCARHTPSGTASRRGNT